LGGRMPKFMAGRLDPQVAFFPVFVAFFGLGFILRPTPVWALVYYVAVMPTFFMLLWSRRGEFSFRDPALGLILALMVWFGLTLSWGLDQTPKRVLKYMFSIPVNASLVAAAYIFFAHAEERFLTPLFRAISVAAVITTLISIILMGDSLGGERLTGWAETRHPILGADVMSVAFVVCLHRAFEDANTIWRRWGAVAAVFCVVFVLLTGSRGPLLALFAAMVCFLVQVRPRAVLILGGGIAVLAALAVPFFPGVVNFAQENLMRNSYRLEIWEETLELVSQRPLLGYGAANVHTFVDPSITFPHSIYMSSLYYAGVAGLLAVLSLFGVTFWRAWSIENRSTRAFVTAMMVVPMVAGLTDIGQFIKSPSEVWYILWLPILTVLGVSRRAARLGS